ncbi:hypothetical protein HK097_007147 [Rhizophlyctis rosea]|uniref:Uncharacterized protein n=1 Tax=Rhizophlyctis rosea TaxID=64517 RepID=A0AAD5SJZ9_9FUNG|nr:hypothetical protein HK097_007147 [Rhizophlyctis rosea]
MVRGQSAYYSEIPTVRCRDCGAVLQFGKKHRCSDLDLKPTRRPKPAPGEPYDDDDYGGRGRNGNGGDNHDRARSRNRDPSRGPTRPPRDRSRPREENGQPRQRSKSRTRDGERRRRSPPEPNSPGGDKKGIDAVMADLMNEMNMDDGRDSGYDKGDEDVPKCGGCNQAIRDPTQAFEIPALNRAVENVALVLEL